MCRLLNIKLSHHTTLLPTLHIEVLHGEIIFYQYHFLLIFSIPSTKLNLFTDTTDTGVYIIILLIVTKLCVNDKNIAEKC